MDDVTLVGIDLGKHSFHLHGPDAKGKAVDRIKNVNFATLIMSTRESSVRHWQARHTA